MFRPTLMLLALLAQSPDPIKPGDDFFAYANGDWLSAGEIPPGMNRWTPSWLAMKTCPVLG